MKKLRAWVAENRLLAASLGVSAAVAVVGLVVALVLGSWLTGTGPDEETGSTTIRNLGFVIAGLIALPLAVWRAQVADQQAEAAREQAEAAERQAETARRSLLHERYQRGAELLRSDALSDRLVGIDALRVLVEERPDEYHILIMRLLCAFARYPTSDGGLDPPTGAKAAAEISQSAPRRRHRLREDVQVALETIGACHEHQLRIEAAGQFSLDLHGADLGGANLYRKNFAAAPWPEVKLRSTTDLAPYHRGTDFSKADLRRAELGAARLWKADFTDAKLEHTTCIMTDLSEANFSGAKLEGAYLLMATLSGARFSTGGMSPATGLTQTQLDDARADPDNPPKLDGVRDAETGSRLVWRGDTLAFKPHPNPPPIPR